MPPQPPSDDGYSASSNPEFKDQEMKPPIHIPPPIHDFFRWLAASITNLVHLDHGARVVGETELPDNVATVLEAQPAHSWGQLGQVAAEAVIGGIAQVVDAIVAHPFVTVAVIWWACESVVQLRHLGRWFRKGGYKEAGSVMLKWLSRLLQ